MATSAVSNLMKSMAEADFHRRRNKKVMKAVAQIEAQGRPLTARNKALCDDYAVSVLGSKVFAPWLHVYSAIRQDFKEGWIPDSYYGRVVVPARKGNYARATTRRAMSRVLFDSADFPDLGHRINGRLFDKDRNLQSETDFLDLVFAEHPTVVCKDDKSRRGKGVLFLDRPGLETFLRQTNQDITIQFPVRQYAPLEAFGSKALSTLRVTTVIDNRGDASVRATYLRLGRADQTHLESERSIYVSIDRETGEARTETVIDDEWNLYRTHPDSGISFAEIQLPDLHPCLSEAKRMHKRVPYAQCIGWDIAFDDTGKFHFLELNGGHNGIDFGEAVEGPCFADLGWEDLWKTPLPDRT